MYRAVHWRAAFCRGNDGCRALTCVLAVVSLLACEPKLVVGKWTCPGADGSGDGLANAGTFSQQLATPWSTGFENGFCDYTRSGFCYSADQAGYETVTSPVHRGRFSAAFSIVADGTRDGHQTRCVREGELPIAAYYSAFFFIPAAPSATTNWNLMHFRGGEAGAFHGLWDVSLLDDDDGALRVFVFDFLRGTTLATSGVPAVPVGAWFQLEAYFQRAADETGAFAVYQDGELALELTDLSTDDSSLGQWYVGNLAAALTPSENTLYVDDVSLREAP